LGKPGIHRAFSEFVVHTPTVASRALAAVGTRRVAEPDLGKPSKTIKPSNDPSDAYLTI
jgi:hypothetical protein